MKAPTVSASAQGDGDAPSTVDLMERLQTSLEETRAGEAKEIDWVTRASPMAVADRIRRLEGELKAVRADLYRAANENLELRAAVKAQAPTLLLKEFRVRDQLAGLLSGAWLLEERGDRCHVAFTRDGDGHITGVALSVEDL